MVGGGGPSSLTIPFVLLPKETNLGEVGGYGIFPGNLVPGMEPSLKAGRSLQVPPRGPQTPPCKCQRRKAFAMGG